ncbi:MAG: hypothetical protein H0U95_01315 [Bacteroidetes bacterium]|nr:hypothetical protein [Bacteroidota bacterium]
MELTAFRKFENGSTDEILICDDIDFKNAGKIVKVYLKNLQEVIPLLPKSTIPVRAFDQKKLYEVLPENEGLTTAQIRAIALSKGVCKERSVDNYIKGLYSSGLLTPISYGVYLKK